jgi:magnesium transporter
MSEGRPKARRERRRRPETIGVPPGTLIADPSAGKPVLHAIAYGPDGASEPPVASVADLAPLLGKWPVLWVNVDGLGDTAVLEQLGTLFGLHRLALEDVLNVAQRPKLERFADRIFLVARMPDVQDGRFCTEQLSAFFGSNFVLTFQERPGDCFDLIRRRLREGKGRLRASGPDYLVYALLDSVVDAYFPVVEACSERLDELEDEILLRSQPDSVTAIHTVRRDLLTVRRSLWPLREAVASMGRDTDTLVAAETRIYLRDCYDHIVELIDLVENYRDIGAGLMEVYLSVVSNRMNEIMKVLTIIATIFIPLTFISSIYGMNFDRSTSPWNMPELGWVYGYPFAMGLMLVTAIALLFYFKRRGWLGRSVLLPPKLAPIVGPGAPPPPPFAAPRPPTAPSAPAATTATAPATATAAPGPAPR